MIQVLPASLCATDAMSSEPAADQPPISRLTRGLTAGDEQAFRDFHRAYFDRLHRYLLVVAHGDETLAADSLQETLCRVARHARVFDDEKIFWDWLTVLGRSAVKDGGRKQSRHRRLLALFSFESPSAPEPNHDEPLLDALSAALGKLDDDDRHMIRRKYDERATAQQIAIESGTTEGAVESRLVRIRRKLRTQLLHHLRHEP